MKLSGGEATIGLLVVGCATAYALLPGDARSIAAPAFACILLVAWLWVALSARNGEPPVVDVGMLCALATLLYIVYPLANYAVDGMQFGILADNRLMNYDIQPDELGLFHWRHVLYLFSFVTAYYYSAGQSPTGVANIAPPKPSVSRSILIVFASLMAYFFVLRIMYGINYNSSYEENTHDLNYAAAQSLPLIVRQISSKFLGILAMAKMALLCFVVSRAKEKKWHYVLLAWGAAETVQMLVVQGARSEFVLFVLAAVFFYNRMIRRLSLKALAASAVCLFAFFIFMGLYRTYQNIAGMSADLLASDANVFTTGNEFQALLGTAYDVLKLKEGGVVLPWYLSINDFINILPPQQLLPFEKVSAAEWYLRETGISGSGLGLMWGVIAQSIVGFDWVELAVRGGVLGLVLARFHRWYLDRRGGFFETVVYIYICTKIYYTFRDTTFSLLTNIVWEVIPLWLLVRILSGLQEKQKEDLAVC